MKALEIRRNVAKLGLARITAAVSPSAAVKVGPLEYRHVDEPDLPGPGWHRVNTHLSGICGSDLSLVEGHASTYFDDWVSFPFVPGHEIVGALDDGTRVIIEPVLGHEARGFAPPFEGAAPGDGDDYAHLATGRPRTRHPDRVLLLDRRRLGTEVRRPRDPAASHRRRHARRAGGPRRADRRRDPRRAARRGPPIAEVAAPVVAVLGAGTMGLAAIAGLRRYVPDVRIVVGARYPIQTRRRDVRRRRHRRRARSSWAAPCGGWSAATSSATTSRSGAHATIDAVGTAASITDCLRITRPRGRVVLLGMPADVTLDLTGLWHRETELKGAYTYGTETLPDGSHARTFDLAIDTADALESERLLSATYRLDDHVDAIAHASAAGRRGAIKIAFDLREEG